MLALLTELGFPQKSGPVYEDNKPAIDSILANRNSTRTRLYQILYFWIKELVDERKTIKLLKVATGLNFSDYWTKMLPRVDMVAAIKPFMLTPPDKRLRPS